MSKIHAVKSALMDLQAQLHQMGYWDEHSPSPEALASTAPFAVDTLELYQWLQWIFIPKMHGFLAQQRLITMACAIAPMAEQWAQMRGITAEELIRILAELDTLLST